MSTSHEYWIVADDPASIGAAVLAAGTALVLVPMPGQGASRRLSVVKAVAADGKVAPDGALVLSHAEWLVYQRTAPGIAHADTPAWTGSEKGVLVPEADGTAALVQAAAATWGDIDGGWDVCERLVLDSEATIGGNVYAAGVWRLVRYTGTKPGALDDYPYLTAAGVAGAVALKEV